MTDREMLQKIYDQRGAVTRETWNELAIHLCASAPTDEQQRLSHFNHALARLQERYGVGMTRNEWVQLSMRLAEQAKALGVRELDALVPHRGKTVRAILDAEKGLVVTFLPRLEGADEGEAA